MTTITDFRPTAAGSGRTATARFARKERGAASVDSARVNALDPA